MNGLVIQNEEKEFFRDTNSIRPKSLAEKLKGNIEHLPLALNSDIAFAQTKQLTNILTHECFSFRLKLQWWSVVPE